MPSPGRSRKKNPAVKRALAVLLLSAAGFLLPSAGPGRRSSIPGGGPYARWTHGPGAKGILFPLAVWLQSPRLAGAYKKIGINLYVGLWKGPTEKQLAALEKAGMPVFCAQNRVGLTSPHRGIIVGWLQKDEPDNAQSRGRGKGYGPPIPPARIQARYKEMVRRDPTRPVYLGLGQGVAWDGWVGRGVRSRHPEDYPEYIKGGDIISFDIYPVASTRKAVAGKLWYVARGVERLVKWSKGKKIVWNCVEAARIRNTRRKVTPRELRAEVWMSIIHGSRGIVYFVHQFKPRFDEHALLDDPPLLRAVASLNKRITSLAPVILSPPLKKGVEVKVLGKGFPPAVTARRHKGSLYLFAAAMRNAPVKVRFRLRLPGLPSRAKAEVLGEKRSLSLENRAFTDSFQGYQVHLYRIHP